MSAFNCYKNDEIFELNSSRDVQNLYRQLEEVNGRSEIEFELPENAGQLFTLSTCDGASGTSNRWTLHYSVTREKYVLE